MQRPYRAGVGKLGLAGHTSSSNLTEELQQQQQVGGWGALVSQLIGGSPTFTSNENHQKVHNKGSLRHCHIQLVVKSTDITGGMQQYNHIQCYD